MKEIADDEWTLCELTGISTENFWTWENTDNMGYDVHDYLAWDNCVDFEGVMVLVGEVHVEKSSECLPGPYEACSQ